MNPNSLKLLIISIVVSYLILGTGLFGDDFTEVVKMSKFSLADFFYPSAYIHEHYILGLTSHYLLFWTYKVLGYEYIFIYDLIKIISHCACIYLVYKFFLDYIKPDRALIASILFIFFPLHDSTTYWFMALVYVIPPSMIAYSHYLIRREKKLGGFLIGLFGSAFFYTSPPYIFGLSMIFLIEKRFKKFILFIIPGVIYLIYYLGIRKLFPFAEKRINDDLEIQELIKNIFTQILSSFEAFLGPSFFLKIYYSLLSLEFISIVIAGLLIYLISKNFQKLSLQTTPLMSINVGLISVLILSFVMFAATGLYNQSPFGLGNRTIIYGSFLVSFWIAVLLPQNKKFVLVLCSIFILTNFGLSDHWKQWGNEQQKIIQNITMDKKLLNLDKNSLLIIKNNLHSKLGPFNHIEFFSMPWNVKSIFIKEYTRGVEVVALASYLDIKNNILVDKKFNHDYPLQNKQIYIYATDTNKLELVDTENLKKQVKDKKTGLRHWIQLLKGSKIETFIIWLNPRLSYIFE